MYCLVYNIAAACLLVYFAAEDHFDVMDCLCVLIPVIMIYKPALGLGFIKHLKHKTIYTNDTGYFFIMFFTLNIIYTLLVLIISIGTLAEWNADLNFPLLLTIFSSGVIFVIASTYVAVFDLPLKKLVLSQRHSEVDTIGEEQVETN